MTDLDVVRRAAKLMNDNSEYLYRYDRKPGVWKPVFRITIKGSRARQLMEQLLPHMGARRQKRIQEILAMPAPIKPGDNSKKLSDEQVRQIFSRCQTGEATDAVAADFGVSGFLVRQIRRRKYRAHALQS